MVWTEVELVRHAYAGGRTEVCTHLCAALHEVVRRIALRYELDGQFSIGKLLRRAHYSGEELLLERYPAQAGAYALGRAAAAAHLGRLLLPLEIIVELGVLRFVLVALLHARHGDVEVYVIGADVAGNDILHAHEGQEIVHFVAVVLKGVLLFDVAAALERQTEHHGTVAVLGNGEIEVRRAYVLACINAYRVLGITALEEHEIASAVAGVFLQLSAVRLCSFGSKVELEYLVLQSHQLPFRLMCCLQHAVGIDGLGCGLRSLFGGRNHIGVRSVGKGVDGHVGQSYRIKLPLLLRTFARLAGFVESESEEDERNDYKSDY